MSKDAIRRHDQAGKMTHLITKALAQVQAMNVAATVRGVAPGRVHGPVGGRLRDLVLPVRRRGHIQHLGLQEHLQAQLGLSTMTPDDRVHFLGGVRLGSFNPLENRVPRGA